jgi:hypothetical protein
MKVPAKAALARAQQSKKILNIGATCAPHRFDIALLELRVRPLQALAHALLF